MKLLLPLAFFVGILGCPVAMAKKNAKKSAKKSDSRDIVVSDSTFIDFTETLVEGGVKAPEGFYLQGRRSQSMTQMVKLRSNFRGALRNSKSAVVSKIK